jgi:hypothetical protein
MDQIYTVEGETIDDVTLNSPFAVAFLAATDAHIVLTEAETITLRTDYVKGSFVKKGLIRAVYKLVE